MAYTFPSEEWVAAYRDAVNASEGYRKAGAAWTHGAVALVVKAEPGVPGLETPRGVWLDLHEGVCRGARAVTADEAAAAPFCITGDYARWKQVLRRQLEPVQGMMQKKLELRGQMTVIVRFVNAARELVEAATRVPTRFADE